MEGLKLVDNCFYKETCLLYSGEHCNDSCIRFAEMKNLFQTSLIPKARWGLEKLSPDEKDLQSYLELNDIKLNITEFVDNGRNLYIWSRSCGNGKTSWAIKLLKSYFNSIWNGNGLRVRGLFLHTPTFLQEIKNQFDNPTDEFQKILDLVTEVDIVVWDDISATRMSEYDTSQLLLFIDKRVSEKRTNIYTGNIAPDNLYTNVGTRLGSRIVELSKCIEFKSNDDRRDIKW